LLGDHFSPCLFGLCGSTDNRIIDGSSDAVLLETLDHPAALVGRERDVVLRNLQASDIKASSACISDPPFVLSLFLALLAALAVQ